jgi:amidase
MSELRWVGATDMAHAIRSAQVTARAVLEALIERVETLNPPLNAVVSTNWQLARAHADAADAQVASGATLGALHGVSMTVKDLLDVKDLECTYGSRQLAGRIADQDAEVVQRLRAAGAIIVGKTNTDTFGMDVQCVSEMYGRTNNPWNLDRTPGGSSGGPAAAIAAGIVPLELGTDASGSLRIPAHCCGVFSHKPTYGLVPNSVPTPPGPGGPPFALLTYGPMARSVADLDLTMSVLADDWPLGSNSPSRAPRIAWSVDFLTPSGRDVRRLFTSVVERAAASGMELVPLDGRAFQLAGQAMQLFGPLASIDPTSHESAELLRQRDSLAQQVDELFADVDAWLLPVMPVPAPPHVESGAPIDVDGEQRDYWPVFTANSAPFNVTGHPATTLPIGLSPDGLPVGIQVIGRRGSDHQLLRVAAQLEAMVRFNAHPRSG